MDENKETTKKPIEKKWWFWVLAIVVIGGIFINSDDTETEKADATDKEQTEQKEDTSEEETESHKLEGKELEANQKENLQKSLDELLEKGEGIIEDITYQDNHKETGEFMKVVVSDTWYDSPKHEKERFAEAIHEQVSHAVWNSGLQEHGDTIVVDIYDSYDKEVAKYKYISDSYKIKE